MKTVLCFGDSNTWGYSPENGQRLAFNARWPGILAQLLGDAFQIIEEGKPGRTSYLNATDFGLSSGITDLLDTVKKHQADYLVLMLGTNDLYPAFKLSAEQVAANQGRMIKQLQAHCLSQHITAPNLLMIAPPTINKTGDFARYFSGADEKSKLLAEHYHVVAHSLGCDYLDAAKLVKVDPKDGVHLNSAQHQILAKAVNAKLQAL
ncbi:GDSL-type esterase/lipase family protein [Agarivorans sp. MS3-6]|uniref:GDSL-type esterase/lipase family protein n=1 Tax=Agarivorans sp. TSD2052 TaxID=2937286 RepID=UPI00200C7B0A|nr:GDSL-type esterase/lipase family protein [Agarivorans sp. TSD2052]UPW16883.1 GDSL-type esterase/lipase family protein [Agarivorans sp. TSD2052]